MTLQEKYQHGLTKMYFSDPDEFRELEGLIRVGREMGLDVTHAEAYVMWREYSSRYSASWLSFKDEWARKILGELISESDLSSQEVNPGGSSNDSN